jgi:hypothetical protein
MNLAVWLVGLWVSTYTLGLEREVRCARRDEIASDLWEQCHDGEYSGNPPLATSAHIAARAAMGLPADLVWRVHAGARHGREGRSTMTPSSLAGRVFTAFVFGVAALPAVWGATRAVGVRGADGVVYGLATLMVGVTLLVGLWLTSRRPSVGIWLVVVGALGVCALWFWMFVIIIPVAVALVVFAYFRARAAGWPRGARGTPA